MEDFQDKKIIDIRACNDKLKRFIADADGPIKRAKTTKDEADDSTEEEPIDPMEFCETVLRDDEDEELEKTGTKVYKTKEMIQPGGPCRNLVKMAAIKSMRQRSLRGLDNRFGYSHLVVVKNEVKNPNSKIYKSKSLIQNSSWTDRKLSIDNVLNCEDNIHSAEKSTASKNKGRAAKNTTQKMEASLENAMKKEEEKSEIEDEEPQVYCICRSSNVNVSRFLFKFNVSKIVTFYIEILTRKVVLWCFFTSEKVHDSTFRVKISD